MKTDFESGYERGIADTREKYVKLFRWAAQSIVDNLEDGEALYEELLLKYGCDHPEVVELRKSLEQTKDALRKALKIQEEND